MPVCTSPSYSQFSSLSLHDALPISLRLALKLFRREPAISVFDWLFTPTHTSSPYFSTYVGSGLQSVLPRSEEHTSELQSRGHLVCRLLLEKKNTTKQYDKRSSIKA